MEEAMQAEIPSYCRAWENELELAEGVAIECVGHGRWERGRGRRTGERGHGGGDEHEGGGLDISVPTRETF